MLGDVGRSAVARCRISYLVLVEKIVFEGFDLNWYS